MTGGNRIDRPGFFMEPTVFADCHNGMKMVREEIFGPVVSVIKFSKGDVQGAIDIANDSDYGLFGGVFTQNKSKANIVVRALKQGSVGNNTYLGQFYDTPFGGYKGSGYLRELSNDGLENYLETKTVIVDCSTP